jgi:hypothetical protein
MNTPVYTARVTQHTRDGHHISSRYWQSYKNTLPPLPQDVFDVAFGMTLGDAGMTRDHDRYEARMKFEQGVKQREFLFHLFDVFRSYRWMEHPGTRYEKADPLTIKSYWFRTFTHPAFTHLFTLFYQPRCDKPGTWKKVISEGLIRDFLTPRALAYWIMSDGYLNRDNKTLNLHTDGFTQQENEIASRELNDKFGVHSRAVRINKKYFMVQIHGTDASRVRDLVAPYMLPCFSYKIPKP